MVCSCQTLCSPSSSPKSFRQCSLEANWAQPGLRRIPSRKYLPYDCNSDWLTVWTPGKKSVYWDWDHQPVIYIYMKLLAESIQWEILMNALIFVVETCSCFTSKELLIPKLDVLVVLRPMDVSPKRSNMGNGRRYRIYLEHPATQMTPLLDG